MRKVPWLSALFLLMPMIAAAQELAKDATLAPPVSNRASVNSESLRVANGSGSFTLAPENVFGSLRSTAAAPAAPKSSGGSDFLNQFSIEYTQVRIRDSSTHFHLNGFTMDYTRWCRNHPWFGFQGEFGYAHGTPFNVSTNLYWYSGGARIRYPDNERWEPWIQLQLGGSHINFKETATSAGHEFFGQYIGTITQAKSTLSGNAFALELGGGLDIKLVPHVNLKLVEADYLYTRFFSNSQNNLEVKSGFRFNF